MLKTLLTATTPKHENHIYSICNTHSSLYNYLRINKTKPMRKWTIQLTDKITNELYYFKTKAERIDQAISRAMEHHNLKFGQCYITSAISELIRT